MDDMPELYLTTGDTVIWLGIKPGQFAGLTKALGLTRCQGRGRGSECRWYRADLLKLKPVAKIMCETGIGAIPAIKVLRALLARAAAKQNGSTE